MNTEEGLNVLSVFDGMSCGQIALNRARIKYKNYYASEIKPHALKVTMKNYPKTIQLGDVRNINYTNLGLEIDSKENCSMRVIVENIDLLIGGSPCQDFSRANIQRKGLDGIKSSLFFEYLRLKKEINPKNWLLENVIMDDYGYKAISDFLETEPIRINSSLVSGQLRDRLYWTNIGPETFDLFGNRKVMIPQPKDKNISLQSILTNGYTDRYKSTCIMEGWSRPNSIHSPEKLYHRYKKYGFTTAVFDSLDFDWKKGIRILNQIEMERLQNVPEGYTSILNRNEAASLLGDGWTIDVIAHILSFLKNE